MNERDRNARISNGLNHGFNFLVITSERVDGKQDEEPTTVHRWGGTRQRITPKMLKNEVCAVVRHQRGSVRDFKVTVYTRTNVTPRQFTNLSKAAQSCMDIKCSLGQYVAARVTTKLSFGPGFDFPPTLKVTTVEE